MFGRILWTEKRNFQMDVTGPQQEMYSPEFEMKKAAEDSVLEIAEDSQVSTSFSNQVSENVRIA